MSRIWLCAAALFGVGLGTAVQAAADPAMAPSSPIATYVPAGTYVYFEILDSLNSKLSKPGDRFRIRTTVPVALGGAAVVPVGALGEGEVIHAARARAAGKAGELILAARFIEHQGRKIALRGFHFAQTGTGRTDEAARVGLIAVPVVLFIGGGDVDVPVGARGQAKLVADLPYVLPADGN